MSDFDYKAAFEEVMHLLNGSSYTQLNEVSKKSRKHFAEVTCGDEWEDGEEEERSGFGFVDEDE